MTAKLRRASIGLAGSLMLSACFTPPRAEHLAAAETIRWAVGPCFGSCPVYSVAITPDGTVTFDGERHTAKLGEEVRQLTAGAYRSAASSLAAFRPATGTVAHTTCDQRISDQSSTRIEWRATDGTVTTLEHDRGCRSARNDQLNATLQEMPAKLGIKEWTMQVTRPR